MSEKFLNPFKENTEPDFIADNGIKWWLQQTMTAYAVRKGLDITVFVFEVPGGYRAYLITQNQRPIHESTSSESILARIDIMAFAQEEK